MNLTTWDLIRTFFVFVQVSIAVAPHVANDPLPGEKIRRKNIEIRRQQEHLAAVDAEFAMMRKRAAAKVIAGDRVDIRLVDFLRDYPCP